MSDTKPARMGFERATEQEQVKLGDCLWDIHAAGMKILEFTSERTLQDFQSSELLQSAVSSMLTIIASRLEDLRRGFPAEFAKLANAHRVMETAASPDDAKIWRLIEESIPELVTQVRSVLEEWHEA